MAREGQGYPCWFCNVMMIKTTYIRLKATESSITLLENSTPEGGRAHIHTHVRAHRHRHKHTHTHTHTHIYIYIYIYIYIVIHRQTCFVLSELFNEATQARFPKLTTKPGWPKRQSKILPLSHEEISASEGNLNGYESQLLWFTYIRLTATESSIHMKNLALR